MDYKKWSWEYLDAAGKVAQSIARKTELIKEHPEERERLSFEINCLTKVHRELVNLASTLAMTEVSDD